MKRILFAVSVGIVVFVNQAYADDGLTLKSAKVPAPTKKDEPISKVFSMEKAVHFMDQASAAWTRDRACFACHTNYAYLYARPMVKGEATVHREIRTSLEEVVTKRWPDKGPRWDAEVVASAAALAFHDALTTKKLHPTTKTALDRMWKVQKDHGGFTWIKCNWPPMENDDHYGATLAVIAVGVAPEGYAKTELAQAGLAKLREYFKKNPPENLHHRLMMLWGASYLPDFASAEFKSATIKEIQAAQRPDGGWSAASFGNWKRGDKTEQDLNTSDGYGTGFAVYVLRRAGVSADEAGLQKGVAWLKANQRESGRWFTRSLFKDNHHFLSHAGTAFAIMAIAECEPKAAVVGSR